MSYVMVFISVLFGAIGQILFKKGMTSIGTFEMSKILSILFTPTIFSGFIFYGISSIMWLYVLSKHQLSTVYPILSLGYILTTVAGYYLFNEKITGVNIAGIVLICLGIILITRK